MPRTPIVGANWKSNPETLNEVNELIDAFNGVDYDHSKVEFVVAPTAVHVAHCKARFQPNIKVALQNCSKDGKGAFTGEVTASMIKDLGHEWVVLGHSERRHKFGETNEDIAAKIAKCGEAGLNIIWCIGELLSEREAGKVEDVIRGQINSGAGSVKDWSKIVIAYEPVWAIGTGVVASPEQAQDAHKVTRAVVEAIAGKDVAEAMRIQYGGSVSPGNCAELISCPDIDGFLVGGAALKPTFGDVIKAVASQ